MPRQSRRPIYRLAMVIFPMDFSCVLGAVRRMGWLGVGVAVNCGCRGGTLTVCDVSDNIRLRWGRRRCFMSAKPSHFGTKNGFSVQPGPKVSTTAGEWQGSGRIPITRRRPPSGGPIFSHIFYGRKGRGFNPGRVEMLAWRGNNGCRVIPTA